MFLWRANPQDDINNYLMFVHIIGKVDSPVVQTGHYKKFEILNSIVNEWCFISRKNNPADQCIHE